MLDRNFVFSLSQDTLIHSQFVQPIRTSLSVDPHQNISTNSEIDGQVTIKINDQFEACIVCLEREQNCVLLECGHSGICVECAQRLRAQAGRCPLCRGGIASMVRIVRRGPTQVRARGALRLRAGAALLTPPSPHDFQCRKQSDKQKRQTKGSRALAPHWHQRIEALKTGSRAAAGRQVAVEPVHGHGGLGGPMARDGGHAPAVFHRTPPAPTTPAQMTVAAGPVRPSSSVLSEVHARAPCPIVRTDRSAPAAGAAAALSTAASPRMCGRHSAVRPHFPHAPPPTPPRLPPRNLLGSDSDDGLDLARMRAGGLDLPPRLRHALTGQ